MTRRAWLATGAALAAVAVAGCGGDDEDADGQAGGGQTATTTQEERAPQGDTGPDEPPLTPGESIVLAGGVQANFQGAATVVGDDVAEMEAESFYFNPTILYGRPGQEVDVRISNTSNVAHTFTLPEQDIDVRLRAAEEARVRDVRFPDSGSLVFTCRFHEDQGMRGALRLR